MYVTLWTKVVSEKVIVVIENKVAKKSCLRTNSETIKMISIFW